MNSPMRPRLASAGVLAVVLVLTGCGHRAPAPLAVPADRSAGDRSVLAGEWEYEDGGAIVLRLDEQGNGTYAFKDGRFETLQLSGKTWIGKWYQKENDREGGFLVNLSADSAEGDGTWWYERIGANTSPSEKGGTFHLTRKTSVTRLGDSPRAP
jgi:predicted small lipoprotein YifL